MIRCFSMRLEYKVCQPAYTYAHSNAAHKADVPYQYRIASVADSTGQTALVKRAHGSRHRLDQSDGGADAS